MKDIIFAVDSSTINKLQLSMKNTDLAAIMNKAI